CQLDFNSSDPGALMRIRAGLVVAAALALSFVSLASAAQQADAGAASVTTDWNKVIGVSQTVPTTQILAHAYTLRDSPIHDALFKALQDLHTDATRLQF